MANTMLVDASHPEETRVVVLRGNRVEEFDFESASRRQLRGNIYLAKVTRVEPSLQAAFVDFGGNRHGFLAFSEIHPDYYQIPVADREALLAEEARSASHDEDEEENGGRRKRRTKPRRNRRSARRTDEETVSEDAAAGDEQEHADAEEAEQDGNGADENGHGDEEDHVEQLGGGDALDEMSERQFRPRRQYKIQEVIKRRQVLLVQVVKEERGTKGAALTTYLSLAGRYSVLMPNTARGGGISRKITSAEDRKRLKTLAQDLEVPEGMGVILRTAGASRTKAEIKRDFEYLLRVWETVRELTLESTAPSLVYEEGSLIKRAIRDLYSKDIVEVHVAGEEGYKEAKDFMRMLMPSHAKVVKPFREPQPLFARFGVEAQLDAMFNNVVTLKSGGYIVINQTEALVAIDVNSGRSTREHNIEDTALKTNLEAADEVARQLRLRDLAGLIVIDFIDMEESRNNKAVERKVKDALKNDRARIQVGRISHFGLLEMSRQRIRTGVLESSTSPCPHCNGTGFLRSTPSLALHLVRAIEDTLLRNAAYNISIRTRTEVAFYVLNHKRPHLRALEERFGVVITILADDHLAGGQAFTIERGEAATGVPQAAKSASSPTAVSMPEDEEAFDDEAVEDEIEETEESEESENGDSAIEAREPAGEGEERGNRRRRRRRRRRGGRPENGQPRSGDDYGEERAADSASGEGAEAPEGDDEPEAGDEPVEAAGDEGEARRRRRRGRRGGRRNRRDDEAADGGSNGFPSDGDLVFAAGVEAEAAEPAAEQPAVIEPEEAPVAEAKPRRTRSRKAAAPATEPAEAGSDAAPEPAAPKPRTRRKAAAAAEAMPVEAIAETPAAPEPEPVVPVIEVSDPDKPKRSGWWAKAKQVIGGE